MESERNNIQYQNSNTKSSKAHRIQLKHQAESPILQNRKSPSRVAQVRAMFMLAERNQMHNKKSDNIGERKMRTDALLVKENKQRSALVHSPRSHGQANSMRSMIKVSQNFAMENLNM